MGKSFKLRARDQRRERKFLESLEAMALKDAKETDGGSGSEQNLPLATNQASRYRAGGTPEHCDAVKPSEGFQRLASEIHDLEGQLEEHKKELRYLRMLEAHRMVAGTSDGEKRVAQKLLEVTRANRIRLESCSAALRGAEVLGGLENGADVSNPVGVSKAVTSGQGGNWTNPNIGKEPVAQKQLPHAWKVGAEGRMRPGTPPWARKVEYYNVDEWKRERDAKWSLIRKPDPTVSSSSKGKKLDSFPVLRMNKYHFAHVDPIVFCEAHGVGELYFLHPSPPIGQRMGGKRAQ